MIAFRFALVAIAALLLAGCHGGVETDVMERELRLQEDHIYHLLDELDQCRLMLEECQRENARLKAGLDGDPPSAGSRVSGDEVPDLDDLEPPAIEPGEEIDGSHEMESLNLDGGPPEEVPLDGEQFVIPSAEQVTVQPVAIGPGSGRDAARAGITALVQPRNAAGEVVHVPAQVSLMIMGTRADGSTTRLGRWDFSAEQAADRWQETHEQAGMRFPLPWPRQSQAATPPFQLWARLVLPEGRKLLAHTDVDVSRITREPARGMASGRAASDGFRARDSGPHRRAGAWTARADRSGEQPVSTAQQRGSPPAPSGAAGGRISRPQASRAAPAWQPYR